MTQVETATPGRLLLLLYDGALKRLHQAKVAMQAGEHETAHRHLLRVQDIVVELLISLDHSTGGEVAGNLHRLYDYLYRTLVQANIRRDVSLIDEVRGILGDLRAAWDQALKGEPVPESEQALPLAAGGEDMRSTGGSQPPGSRLNLQG